MGKDRSRKTPAGESSGGAALLGYQGKFTAAEFARKTIVKRFSAFAWPGAVDLSAGTAYSHDGAVLIGGIYAGWMRKRMAAVLGSHG